MNVHTKHTHFGYYHVCRLLMIAIWIGITTPLFPAFKSTTGTIIFDTNRDGFAEVMIDNDGTTLHHSLNRGFQTVSANTTLSSNSVIFANTSQSTLTLTLPYAGNVIGRTYTIKKTEPDNSLYLTVSDNYIDNSRILDIGELSTGWYPTIDLISDGINWHVLQAGNGGSTVAAANLIAWFPLNHSNGATLSDISSNSLSASLNGDAAVSTANSAIGRGAVSLDGTGDYIVTSGFSESYDYFSVAFFAYHTSIAQLHDMVSREDGTGTGRSLLYESWGDVIAAYVAGTTYNSTYTPATNQWIHYALVYDNGTFYIYADGSLILTFVDNEENASGEFVFGSHKNKASNFFNGLLDDIRIYDKALNIDEVKALSDMRE